MHARNRRPMNAEDSARMRDLLASNRTLLAWVRTAVSLAGLGFVVARFGLFLDSLKPVAGRPANAGLVHFSGYLGFFLAVAAVLLTIVGFIQHQSVVAQEAPQPDSPQPLRWPTVVATVTCALACATLAVYLAVTPA
jgi:inner membrane protein YidH